jgi:hypothetical protein
MLQHEPSPRPTSGEAGIEGIVCFLIDHDIIGARRADCVTHHELCEQSLRVSTNVKKELSVGRPREIWGRARELICKVLAALGIEDPDVVNTSPYKILRDGNVAAVIRGQQIRQTVLMVELFPGTQSRQLQSNKELQFAESVTTTWFRNIYLIPIDYATTVLAR